MSRIYHRIASVVLGFSLFVFTQQSFANDATEQSNEATLVGKFKDWSVYKAPDGTMFMASKAIKQNRKFNL